MTQQSTERRTFAREIDILVEDYVPEEIRTMVLDMVQKFAFVLPNWIQTVCIDFKTDSGDSIAECWTGYNTRDIVIYVNGNFLTSSDRSKEIAIIHEMCHAIWQPAAIAVHRKMQEKDIIKLSDLLPHSVIDGIEQCVQDTALSLYRCYYMDREEDK